MTGSSGPTMASTFWKKLIHGAMSCVQLTFSDSVLCSRKLPAVWKNFFGMIGARRRVSASATRSPVSAAPPRSKYSRIVGTSRTEISSRSIRPRVDSTQPPSHDAADAHRNPGVRLGRADEALDLQVLALLDVQQA